MYQLEPVRNNYKTMVQITHNLNGTCVSCVWSEPHMCVYLNGTHMYMHMQYLHVHVFTQ